MIPANSHGSTAATTPALPPSAGVLTRSTVTPVSDVPTDADAPRRPETSAGLSPAATTMHA